MMEDVVWIYDGKQRQTRSKPPHMSDSLMELIRCYHRAYPFVHIHDVGTVGDARHLIFSPNSYHNHRPPDAIDITAIGEYDCRIIEQRMAVAERFAALGGVLFHAGNRRRKHLHVQTPGYYARKYRRGEINLK